MHSVEGEKKTVACVFSEGKNDPCGEGEKAPGSSCRCREKKPFIKKKKKGETPARRGKKRTSALAKKRGPREEGGRPGGESTLVRACRERGEALFYPEKEGPAAFPQVKAEPPPVAGRKGRGLFQRRKASSGGFCLVQKKGGKSPH